MTGIKQTEAVDSHYATMPNSDFYRLQNDNV